MPKRAEAVKQRTIFKMGNKRVGEDDKWWEKGTDLWERIRDKAVQQFKNYLASPLYKGNFIKEEHI